MPSFRDLHNVMLGSGDRLPGIWLMNHKPVYKLQKQEGAAETPQHANDATVKASRAIIHSGGLERVSGKRYHGIKDYFTYTPTETFLSLVDRKMIEMIPDMLTMKHVTLDPCILIVYYVILWRGCYILNTRSFHSPDRKYARQLYLCCLRAIPTWQQEATGSITDFIAAIFMTGVATEMFDFDSSLEMHQLACDYAKGLHLHSLDGYDYFAVTEPGSTRTDDDRRGMWELIQTDLFYHLIYNKPAKLFRSLDSWQVNLPWLSLDSTPNNDAPVPTIAFLVRSRLTFVLIHFFQMIKTLDNESEAVNSIEPLCHEIESLLEEWRIEDWVQRSAHENDMINLWILGDLLLNGYTCIIFMLRKATLLKTNSPNPISSDDNIPKTDLSTRISRRILELTYLMLHVWRFPAAEAISYILGAYRAHIAYAHIASNMINSPGLEEDATADLDLLDRVAQSIETAAQEECDFAPLVRVMKKINTEVRERVTGVAEKVLFAHADNIGDEPLHRGKTQLKLRPRRIACQDATAQMAIIQFMSAGLDSTAVPTTVHCDHLIVGRTGQDEDLPQALSTHKEVYDFLSSACKRYGMGFWKPGAGIIHQTVLENYAFPGGMMVGTDSHTPNAGGMGMIAIGVGGADAVDVMAGLPFELTAPHIIGVRLTGQLSGWATPKDVINKLAGILTVKGGTGAIIEFFGPGTESLSATGMATICNMGAETGATTSIFPYSEAMRSYLQATHRHDIADAVRFASSELRADEDAQYDRIIDINLSELEPIINGPFTPDLSTPISKLSDAVEKEDMEKGVKNSILTSYNRNFTGRLDGNPATHIFLASPEMVMAKIFSDDLSFNPTSDSIVTPSGSDFRFKPPGGEALPSDGYANTDYVYSPPPSTGRNEVEVQIAETSKRLQRLAPFEPWHGKDFENCAILIKVQGKCTTDHITPAGPWFAYRGHLGNISNNTLIGAVNAETGKVNQVKNWLTGEDGDVPGTARAYKEASQPWVVIGDHNYGEGSSREHAALQPRYLGCVAIMAKSFARIHETNLKKQGVLALKFVKEGDYERISSSDRISIVGIKNLQPGKNVEVRITPTAAGRKSFSIQLSHTLTGEQIEYFREGSALNLMAKRKQAKEVLL
ncbi:aconitate hydratase [Colletotrichum sp. SAR11_239]|nr:aconitate hydratase [Colletotrichum sp. SAR11_239]